MIRDIHPWSGFRIQGSKRHRIPDPDLQQCLEGLSLNNIDEETGMPARAQNRNKFPKIKSKLFVCENQIGFDLARVFESRKMCTDSKIGYKKSCNFEVTGCIAPVVWSFSSTTAQLYASNATHRKGSERRKRHLFLSAQDWGHADVA